MTIKTYECDNANERNNKAMRSRKIDIQKDNKVTRRNGADQDVSSPSTTPNRENMLTKSKPRPKTEPKTKGKTEKTKTFTEP